MAKKQSKAAQPDAHVEQRGRLPRSVRLQIRRLKAAGRVDEAHAVLRAALDRKRGAAHG